MQQYSENRSPEQEAPTVAVTSATHAIAGDTIPAPRIGIDWSIAGPLLAAHMVAMAAPFTFTWTGLALFAGLYLVSGFGVTVGAHRLFTHQSFRASRFVRRVLAVMFLMSAQGSLLRWVRDHHIHHRYSDRDGDPHTPHLGHGFWYAQLTWLWKRPPTRAENKRLYERFGAGLKDDRFVQQLSRPAVLVAMHVAIIALVYVIGAWSASGISLAGLATGAHTGISCIVWGVFLRIVVVLHATSLVNSATHLWGYRPYDTPEGSRNNWWVAVVSLGEGWHNNHHGRPAAANQGFHRWWEFDISFCVLYLAACLGCVTDLRVYRAATGKTEIWFPRRHPATASTAT